MEKIYHIYADHNDHLDDDTIEDILDANQPMDRFMEVMDERYIDYPFELEILAEMRHNGATEDDDILLEQIREQTVVEYPTDHFLKQTVYLNIFLDTGDGNYDFVLNAAHVPHYEGTTDDLNEKASILWLAKQQGYTAKQLNQYLLKEYEEIDKKSFLDSVWNEIANASSGLLTTAFLVQTTLENAIKLNEALKEDDSNNKSITLDKSVVCGLYSPWSGAGGLLDIQLDKNVVIPLNIIRSATIDGCDHYSITNCYGVDHSLWTDCIKTWNNF